MAIVKCKECGGDVSTEAKTCPHCGAPVEAEEGIGKRILIGIVAIVVISIIGSRCSTNTAEPTVPPTPAAALELPQQVVGEAPTTVVQTTPKVGEQWSYYTNDDGMTGKQSKSAIVESTNQFEFGFPYAGLQNAKLTLRRHPRFGDDVILSIERGQILCRSYEDCSVTVRFDDEKPVQLSGIGPADNSSDTVFIRGFDRFKNKLVKAKVVRVSVGVYQEGEPVFEFNTEGFDPTRIK